MPIATTLNLAVADYKDAQHWYWRLTDGDGQFLADQEVNLNPSDAEYEGFLDLPSYLAKHAVPYRRREDEARLVRQLGEWMGRNFYGPIGDKILDAGTPALCGCRFRRRLRDCCIVHGNWGMCRDSRWHCKT